jgi:hypothetical protein
MSENMKEIEELIKKVEGGYTAKITAIEKTTSEEFFGKTKYEDREGYSVTFQLEEIDYEWTEFFNIPKPLGIEESKIYKFKNKYGELPKVGLKVTAGTVEGNFRVLL